METLETDDGSFYTVFAPTNAAFTKLDENVIRSLTDDRDLLESVLKYHVVPEGKLFSGVIKNDLEAPTLLEDRKLRFNVNDLGVTVNGAEIDIDKVDQRAANGVVHMMNEVIYPIPVGSIYDVLVDDNRFISLVRSAFFQSGILEKIRSVQISFPGPSTSPASSTL